MKLLFVCTGNTCRSPMAEGILREMAREEGLDLEVGSAGLATFKGAHPSQNSVLAMEELGIDISQHRSRQLDKALLEDYDLVLTMSRSHRDNIAYQYQPRPGQLYTLLDYAQGLEGDIEDPFSMDLATYRRTRDEIYKSIRRMVEDMKTYKDSNYRLGIASDHGGYDLKEELKAYLEELGVDCRDYGTNSKESVDYPEYGRKLGQAVAQGEVDEGIVICGTGIGISLAANKVRGIRCALCSDTYSARMSKAHNNANMLALGGRVLGVDLAKEIVLAWLNEEFEGGRHERRVNKIEE